MSLDTGARFLRLTRGYLVAEYPAKLRLAVAKLSEDDLWWRPGPESNSVGNLILHLSGNARQWIVAGVGGRPDVRDRTAEFERSAGGPAEVLRVFDETIAEVNTVLEDVGPEDLADTRVIQGLQVDVQEALLHVTEHVSMHLGQILWIVKARSREPLGFYELDDDGRVVDTHW